MNSLNITKSTDELKQLIAENPDLPIVFLVGQYAASENYGWTYCHDIHFSIEEILDCELPFGYGYIYNDPMEFEEALADYLAELPECEDLFDMDFDNYLGEKLKEYKPYWKKVIAIYADN